jgi:hypothetical protein
VRGWIDAGGFIDLRSGTGRRRIGGFDECRSSSEYESASKKKNDNKTRNKETMRAVVVEESGDGVRESGVVAANAGTPFRIWPCLWLVHST